MASQPIPRARKAPAAKPEVSPDPAPTVEPVKVDPRARPHTVQVGEERITLGIIVH